MKSSVGASLYRGIVKRRKTVLAVSILVTVLVFFVDVSLGPMRYGLAEVIQAIFNPDPESVIYSVVWESRIPEALTALLVGLALGMTGAEMQTILDNPLAEPYTLGISTSAAFGASLVIAFGLGGSVFGDYAQPVLAFACAILTCFVIYSVARSRSGDRNTIILLGVAMLFLFQSLVSLIQSVSSRDSANAIMFWMFGSLDRTEWVDLLIIAVVIAIAAVFFAINFWRLTALRMGDSKARSLGVDVGRLRRNVLLAVSAVTALAVSFAGTIGFVGLVGPHMARMLVGEDQRFLMPMSAVCGALMLLAAAIVCKLLESAVSLHIGVVTSLVGVPFFIYMIMRSRRSAA